MDEPRSFGALKAAAERAAAAAAGGALRLAGTWQHKGLAPGGDALAKIGAHVRAALGAAFGEGGGASRGAGGVGASHAIVLEDDLEARGPRVLMARRPASQAEGLGGDGVARRCPMRTPSQQRDGTAPSSSSHREDTDRLSNATSKPSKTNHLEAGDGRLQSRLATAGFRRDESRRRVAREEPSPRATTRRHDRACDRPSDETVPRRREIDRSFAPPLTTDEA
jgi:hypothetical protein